MKQQFNVGTVKEQRIKALIIQYDDCIRYQKKLLDCYLAEALHSVIPTCLNNPETLETEIAKKNMECEQLKLSLESAQDRVTKFCTKHFENVAMKELLDFAVSLSIFRDSNEDTDSTSKTEKEKLFQYFGISSNIYYAKEWIKVEHELNGGKLQSDEVTGEETSSILPLNVINEDLLTLNSKLELAQESLNSEKLRSKQLKCERDRLDYLSDELCNLLCKYQERIGIPPEKNKKKGQTSNNSDHPNIKAACDSSLHTKRDTLQLDVECSSGKLKPSTSQNLKVNRSRRKYIDSVSTISKTSDGSPGERCIICNRYYSTKFVLNRHIRGVHYGEKPYECTECGKSFAYRISLSRHTLVHDSRKPFKCAVCKAGFKYRSVKTRHERDIHGGGGHLQCAHCDKRVGDKRSLISHLHTKHFSR